jgi:hypothetical protein
MLKLENSARGARLARRAKQSPDGLYGDGFRLRRRACQSGPVNRAPDRAVPPPPCGCKPQKGLTITRTTMSAIAMAGTSFNKRSALPLNGRSPRASFLP